MKKLLIISIALFFSMFNLSANAAAQDELSRRIATANGFSANFAQTVVSAENEVIMQGEGKVEIARPSLFRWTTLFPDETTLVSDGETLWYYSPFIEQVTIYWQAQATEQTPFILLTRNQASDWDNYQVSQAGDKFTLVPKNADSNQGQFEVEINNKGVIKGFKVIEQDGQVSAFEFSDYHAQVPDKNRFVFVIPDGVEVDDQRN